MVTLKEITKSFGETMVIRRFDAVFEKGEFITLLGPSGCGKSTLLRMIAGFERPTGGEISIDGQMMTGPKTFVPPERRGIGMVFQSYAVWPHMTIRENVAYPLTIRKMDKESIRKNVDRVLEIVHLNQYAERYPNQLSGGQQQRVALARALVAEPALMLLDEPLSNLDAKLRESMRFEIKEIQRKLGITVVYVTHDQAEAMAMSDRIFVINGGEVQQCGTPEEIYNTPANQFVADFLGKVQFFKGEAGEGEIRITELDGTRMAYTGSVRGKADVAIRPENVYFTENGVLEGVLERQYYMGDTDDCRVRIGERLVRVIAGGHEYQEMREGQKVRLGIRSFTVFPEDGSLEEMLRIQT